eukprot:jgi/Botrbrau1/10226/Bobra.0362s0016.1
MANESHHLVVPVNMEATAYEGFLRLPEAGHLKTSLWISVVGINPRKATLEDAKLDVSEELADLLQGHEETVRTRMREATSISTFLSELANLARHLLSRRPPLATPAPEFYSRLLTDIAEIGWSNVVWMDAHLTTFRFQISDAAGRRHQLMVRLPPQYPGRAPTVALQLPEPLKLTWQPDYGLPALLQQCQSAMAKYQDLWACLEDLDRHAWVMEPEQPSPEDRDRRIAVGQHCSMHITLDVQKPRAYPRYGLMGPDSAVAELRQCLHDRQGLWDESRMPRENLEEVLGQQLPKKLAAAQMEDASLDCCICYAYRLPTEDGQQGPVPDVHCDNRRCSRPFHRACLLEWLQSVPGTRKSFSTVFGQCPFCEEPVAVKALCHDV